MGPAALTLAVALVAAGLAALVRWVRVVRARALTRTERGLLAVVVGAVIGLAALMAAFAVVADPRSLDVTAHELFGAGQADPRVKAVLALTLLGEWRLHFLALLAVGVPMLRRTHGWLLGLYGAAMIGTGLSVLAVKTGLGRARPVDMLVALTDRSFPSGHAAMGLAFWFSAGVLIARGGGLARRALGVAVAVALPPVVAWTRLFLRVHWLSDILGGFTIALFWLTLAVLADRFAEDEPHLARLKTRLEGRVLP